MRKELPPIILLYAAVNIQLSGYVVSRLSEKKINNCILLLIEILLVHGNSLIVHAVTAFLKIYYYIVSTILFRKIAENAFRFFLFPNGTQLAAYRATIIAYVMTSCIIVL